MGVRMNARAPDFTGLETYLSNALDGSGGVVCLEFERHIAELQNGQTAIDKQQRLAAEEAEATSKRKKEKEKGSGKKATEGDA